MPRVFLGNFEFEHELEWAGGASFRPAPPRKRQLADAKRAGDRSWVWMAIAVPDDIVVTEGKIEASDFGPLARLGLPAPRSCHSLDQLPKGEEWQLVPWGWTESLEQLGLANGWTCHAPPAAVVRQVNSREFRSRLECEWNIGLPGAAIARSLAELEAAIATAGDNPRGWILKANYGMAGREAMRGRGRALAGNLQNWAERRFVTSGPIVFEPLVERIAEAGIQIEIQRAGTPELMGVTPLLVDGSGVYRGSRFGCQPEETACWQPAVDIGLRTASELQRLGYFGPLGIDAMLYRDDAGVTRLRPLQDLNARYTMGRLALGFGRVLPGRTPADQAALSGLGVSKNIVTSPPLPPPYEGGERLSGECREISDRQPAAKENAWCGSWLHFGGRHVSGRELLPWLETVQSALPAGAMAVPASPRSSSAMSSHAVLVIAPSPAIRKSAESIVFNSLGIFAS